MSDVRSKNTRPELTVRQGLHRRGFRFRLHCPGLPGKPDLVFPKYRAVILVNGCFWHGHQCSLFKWPATRQEYWKSKIEANRLRDTKIMKELGQKGWRTLVIWECAMKGKGKIPAVSIIDTCAVWLTGNNREGNIRGNDNVSGI
jgi:DNA mismatch endonuclease, patch repair protein